MTPPDCRLGGRVQDWRSCGASVTGMRQIMKPSVPGDMLMCEMFGKTPHATANMLQDTNQQSTHDPVAVTHFSLDILRLQYAVWQPSRVASEWHNIHGQGHVTSTLFAHAPRHADDGRLALSVRHAFTPATGRSPSQ